MVRSAIRRDEAVRVRRNAYVLAEVWRAARPAEQFALRTRAILRTRPGDIASHQSALALHGLPTWGLPTDRVHLMAAVGRTRTAAGARFHPRADTEPVDVSGSLSVSIEMAIAQVALDHSAKAVVPLDQALHERRCRLERVGAVGEQIARGPLDRARLEATLSQADPDCESVGETRTRLLLQDLGFPVRSQVTISDVDGAFVGRVDFMIGDLIVVEFDGMVKYEGAEGRAALAREKAREERLTALGCVVIRLVWADLDHPDRVRGMVESAHRRIAQRR